MTTTVTYRAQDSNFSDFTGSFSSVATVTVTVTGTYVDVTAPTFGSSSPADDTGLHATPI